MFIHSCDPVALLTCCHTYRSVCWGKSLLSSLMLHFCIQVFNSNDTVNESYSRDIKVKTFKKFVLLIERSRAMFITEPADTFSRKTKKKPRIFHWVKTSKPLRKALVTFLYQNRISSTPLWKNENWDMNNAFPRKADSWNDKYGKWLQVSIFKSSWEAQTGPFHHDPDIFKKEKKILKSIIFIFDFILPQVHG